MNTQLSSHDLPPHQTPATSHTPRRESSPAGQMFSVRRVALYLLAAALLFELAWR
ncbi:MAG: hypothetical protein ACK4KV_18655 [Rhodocyclaceae bacterium]